MTFIERAGAVAVGLFTAYCVFLRGGLGPDGSHKPIEAGSTPAPATISITPGEELILRNQQVLDAKLDELLRRGNPPVVDLYHNPQPPKALL